MVYSRWRYPLRRRSTVPRHANYLDRFGTLEPTDRPELPELAAYLEQTLDTDTPGIAGAANAGPLAADIRSAIDTHFDLALGGTRL
jgi:hypothetical protein